MKKKTLSPRGSSAVYLYGYHACRQALYNKNRVVDRVYFRDQKQAEAFFSSLDQEFTLLNRENFLNIVQLLTPKEMDALLPADSVHQGIIFKVQPLPAYDLSHLSSLKSSVSCVLVLDQVTDPHNVGAILRSSAVFNVDAVVMCSRNSPRESGVLAKSASGALDIVPMSVVPNLAAAIEELKTYGYWIVGFSDKADKSLKQLDLKGKVALVFGAEGEGMRLLTSRLCDFHGKIFSSLSFSTLNVSNAVAIVLYEVFEQNR